MALSQTRLVRRQNNMNQRIIGSFQMSSTLPASTLRGGKTGKWGGERRRQTGPCSCRTGRGDPPTRSVFWGILTVGSKDGFATQRRVYRTRDCSTFAYLRTVLRSRQPRILAPREPGRLSAQAVAKCSSLRSTRHVLRPCFHDHSRQPTIRWQSGVYCCQMVHNLIAQTIPCSSSAIAGEMDPIDNCKSDHVAVLSCQR